MSETQGNILIVEDDQTIGEGLLAALEHERFDVRHVETAEDAQEAIRTTVPDLLICDIMLPGMDGLQLMRKVKQDYENLPVIMLTAKGDEIDRVMGLEMGADDYVTKPFHPHELVARVRAVLRRVGTLPDRAEAMPETVLRFADWTLDPTRRRLEAPDGVSVALSDGEFDLLLAFAEHPRRVLSRDQLLDLTRGRAAAPFDRSVDVQVGRLRRKIETDPKRPELIKTVRGGGYLFTPAVDHA